MANNLNAHIDSVTLANQRASDCLYSGLQQSELVQSRHTYLYDIYDYTGTTLVRSFIYMPHTGYTSFVNDPFDGHSSSELGP